jgi:hypothetical protein
VGQSVYTKDILVTERGGVGNNKLGRSKDE